MKKTMLFLVAMVAIGMVQEANAQAKKFKLVKVSRDTKREVKKLEKEGWNNLPGDMPIGQQLNNAWAKEAEVDDEGLPKWVVATGESVAEFQSTAEMQALELAKLNLVRLLESQMRSVVETEQANNRLDAKSAASISKTMEVATNKVSKKLSRVMPVVKMHREVKKSTQMQVKIAYNYALARKAILDEMKLELQNESEDMRAKYDKFLNPEMYKQGDISNVAGEQPAK
ncbi:hypothetical protein AEM51_00775 [Bacteroidetes bacterium UKL13-3]|nr:hypothetical protein AEM51_00775 [Bacteroidetes bacterium UKL13-3]HCP93520.1 hypothetical protein [Bacteroidota bacterium]